MLHVISVKSKCTSEGRNNTVVISKIPQHVVGELAIICGSPTFKKWIPH